MPTNHWKEFSSIDGLKIDVNFESSENYLKINCVNTHFQEIKAIKQRNISLLIFTYFIYLYAFSGNQKLLVHVLFMAILFVLGYSLFNLVEKESICIVKGFALESSTIRYLGRKSSFVVPFQYLHDVIINEVIYFQRMIFVLAVLTKDDFFKSKPIIVLFNNLHPRLECLQSMYRRIKQLIDP